MSKCTCHYDITWCSYCIEQNIINNPPPLEINIINKGKTMSDNKVLVDPSEYKNLKEGDEIEVIIKGRIKSYAKCIQLIGLHGNSNYSYFNDIQSIYKILPKATPLEVGEIVKNSTHSYVVRAINSVRNSSLNCFVLQVNEENGYIYNYSISTITLELKTLVRESGVPIDWDATFRS